MSLNLSIHRQLNRIGGSVPANSSYSSPRYFAIDAKFPAAAFRSRDTDEIHGIRQFHFLGDDTRGKLWDNWEEDLAATDPNRFIPFGSDENYYYFVADNPTDDTDPGVYSVDHEESNEEPYDLRGMSLSRFLSFLELEDRG